MVSNFYFNNFQSSQEQTLLENLIIESIKIYGQDMLYVPRKLNNKNEVYGEDDISTYENSYMIELFIKSIDGFAGDGNFMSKFGLEIRDQVTFTVARRTFELEITTQGDYDRPREGDLIYFPLNKKLFQIKYVDNKVMFYTLGTLPVFDLVCELFEYSGEQFNTGIPEIDDIQDKLSTNVFDYVIMTEDSFALMTEDGNYIVNENYKIGSIDGNADNDDIEQEALNFLDFTEKDPFSESGIY